MPSIYDSTVLFEKDAVNRFTEVFEGGASLTGQTSSKNKLPDSQNRLKQLEAKNAMLKSNLKTVESRLNAVLLENSKLKGSIEELKELSRLSPVKPSKSAVVDEKVLKPYIDELAQLKAKLLAYEAVENPDATRIVRFTRNNPFDEALKAREPLKVILPKKLSADKIKKDVTVVPNFK